MIDGRRSHGNACNAVGLCVPTDKKPTHNIGVYLQFSARQEITTACFDAAGSEALPWENPADRVFGVATGP